MSIVPDRVTHRSAAPSGALSFSAEGGQRGGGGRPSATRSRARPRQRPARTAARHLRVRQVTDPTKTPRRQHSTSPSIGRARPHATCLAPERPSRLRLRAAPPARGRSRSAPPLETPVFFFWSITSPPARCRDRGRRDPARRAPAGRRAAAETPRSRRSAEPQLPDPAAGARSRAGANARADAVSLQLPSSPTCLPRAPGGTIRRTPGSLAPGRRARRAGIVGLWSDERRLLHVRECGGDQASVTRRATPVAGAAGARIHAPTCGPAAGASLLERT